jgi:hypothetical protein
MMRTSVVVTSPGTPAAAAAAAVVSAVVDFSIPPHSWLCPMQDSVENLCRKKAVTECHSKQECTDTASKGNGYE